jgi:hypothetical protein
MHPGTRGEKMSPEPLTFLIAALNDEAANLKRVCRFS